MSRAPISLHKVNPRRRGAYWHPFEVSDQFVKPWWGRQSTVDSSEHWISVRDAGTEVARCKFLLFESSRFNPVLGPMPAGQLDIVALEVAAPSRRSGVGREVLLALRRMYPLPKLTALNDDADSRGFWDAVGWTRHESPHEWLRTERVTYSEPRSSTD